VVIDSDDETEEVTEKEEKVTETGEKVTEKVTEKDLATMFAEVVEKQPLEAQRLQVGI